MRDVRDVADLREIVQTARCSGASIGFVPTLGYLHEGHLRLVAQARDENDLVVMSIFVNPTQFGPNEDYERYPRNVDRDRRMAKGAGVDILYLPELTTMYPDGAEGQAVWVEPGPLAAHLCGASRPGHFRGVATVVTKLFNMALPDRAYFGQKDAQQAIIIKRLVRDLAMNIEIRIVATVREPDGLALSSRNVYLSPEERAQATGLWRALELASQAITRGERDPRRIEDSVRNTLGRLAPSARIDYVTLADLGTLQPLEGPLSGDAVLAIAAYFGPTRLIDNRLIRWERSTPVFS